MVGRDLGHGILLYQGDDPACVSTLEETHHKFLNELWLPTPLGSLSPEQISVINRYREERIARDGQFVSAATARSAYIYLIDRLCATSLLEVGCGKFPLSSDRKELRYLGIEIDHEAIIWNIAEGREVREPTEIERNPDIVSDGFDLICGSYVFHFPIEESLIRCLNDASRVDSVFAFNIIVDQTGDTLALQSRLLPYWPRLSIIKHGAMSRREYWFLFCKEEGKERLDLASAALNEFWTASTVAE